MSLFELTQEQQVDLIIASISGVGTGLLSSYIFLMYFLRFKKPSMEIANCISLTVEDDGSECYWFKIVNKTDYAVYSVQVSAFFMTPVGSDGGQNLSIEPINLKYNSYYHIPSKNKKDIHALHAVRVRCFEQIQSKWGKSTFLRVEVFAKHELSGFSKIFVKDFHKPTCIKKGEFKFGDELTIS